MIFGIQCPRCFLKYDAHVVQARFFWCKHIACLPCITKLPKVGCYLGCPESLEHHIGDIDGLDALQITDSNTRITHTLDLNLRDIAQITTARTRLEQRKRLTGGQGIYLAESQMRDYEKSYEDSVKRALDKAHHDLTARPSSIGLTSTESHGDSTTSSGASSPGTSGARLEEAVTSGIGCPETTVPSLDLEAAMAVGETLAQRRAKPSLSIKTSRRRSPSTIAGEEEDDDVCLKQSLELDVGGLFQGFESPSESSPNSSSPSPVTLRPITNAERAYLTRSFE